MTAVLLRVMRERVHVFFCYFKNAMRDSVRSSTTETVCLRAAVTAPVVLESLCGASHVYPCSVVFTPDRPARRSTASRPLCFTQMWMVSVINW